MKEISLRDFKTYTATIIKTVVSVETMEQNKELRNRLAQICPRDFSQRHNTNLTEVRVFSTNGAGATGHPQTKTRISHVIKKFTQNGSQT